ncbi:hypothetical protein AAY473_001225 [Plecturocebus cupreus]
MLPTSRFAALVSGPLNWVAEKKVEVMWERIIPAFSPPTLHKITHRVADHQSTRAKPYHANICTASAYTTYPNAALAKWELNNENTRTQGGKNHTAGPIGEGQPTVIYPPLPLKVLGLQKGAIVPCLEYFLMFSLVIYVSSLSFTLSLRLECTLVHSWLTTPSASWVQGILLPQPPP